MNSQAVILIRKDGLNNIRRERFCQQMATHGVASKAAVEAGYSPRSAHSTGCDLRKEPEIQKRIEELTAEQLNNKDASAKFLHAQLIRSINDPMVSRVQKNADKKILLNMIQRNLVPFSIDDDVKEILESVNKS